MTKEQSNVPWWNVTKYIYSRVVPKVNSITLYSSSSILCHFILVPGGNILLSLHLSDTYSYISY